MTSTEIATRPRSTFWLDGLALLVERQRQDFAQIRMQMEHLEGLRQPSVCHGHAGAAAHAITNGDLCCGTWGEEGGWCADHCPAER